LNSPIFPSRQLAHVVTQVDHKQIILKLSQTLQPCESICNSNNNHQKSNTKYLAAKAATSRTPHKHFMVISTRVWRDKATIYTQVQLTAGLYEMRRVF